MTSSRDQVLTTSEAADRLGITNATIRAQIGKGKLHGERHGGVWILTVDEVVRYARENQVHRKGGRARSSPLASRADRTQQPSSGPSTEHDQKPESAIHLPRR